MKSLKAFHQMDFDIMEWIIMTLGYGSMLYTAVTYWESRVMQLAVIAILFLPLLIILQISAGKYIVAYEVILIDYAIVGGLCTLAATGLFHLRGQKLYLAITTIMIYLGVVVIFGILGNLHLKKDVKTAKIMIDIAIDIICIMYIIAILFGIAKYLSIKLFAIMLLLCLLLRIFSLVMIRRHEICLFKGNNE